MKNLGLSVRYSREEVHDIFSPDTVFTPRTGAWGLRGIFEEVRYEFGTPKYMRVYREDGTIADEKGFFDRKIIERIVG